MEHNCEDPFIRLAENPRCGVLIAWEIRSARPAFLWLQRSTTGINGAYQTILTLPGYTTTWIDDRGSPNFFYKIVEIASDNTVTLEQSPISGEEMLIKATVMFHIQNFMRMPVYAEEATAIDSLRTKFRFTFNKWSTSLPRPLVEITGSSIEGGSDTWIPLDDSTPIYSTQLQLNSSTGAYTPAENYARGLKYKLDYQGQIYFINANNEPVSLSQFDTVRCSYHVRLFSMSQINDGLNWALQELNAQPGSRMYYRPIEAPFWYDAALTNGCVYFLLRQMLLSLTGREKRYLFQDSETGSFDAIGLIKDMLKEYKEYFDENKKKVPIARFPRTLAIVQEQFQLPGSRSAGFRAMFGATGGYM